MREIIFDTETTGLDNRADRVIEIGGIELFNHFPTGKTIHLYINPGDRKVHPDALAVHGITDEFLKDKPPFADVVDQILDFFGEAKWIAHNATFDMGFVNAEFARIGRPPILPDTVIDTLAMARRNARTTMNAKRATRRIHSAIPNSSAATAKTKSVWLSGKMRLTVPSPGPRLLLQPPLLLLVLQKRWVILAGRGHLLWKSGKRVLVLGWLGRLAFLGHGWRLL